MAEPFEIKKAVELSGVTIFKSLKFGLIFLAILGIGYGVYKAYFKKPPDTTTQKAEQIVNVTEVKEEAAIELSLFPPKAKIGSFKFKIFDFK